MKNFIKKIFLLMFFFMISIAEAGSSSITILADEFQVNQNTIDNQDHATVSMDQYGTSMVAWHDYGSIDGDGKIKSLLRLLTLHFAFFYPFTIFAH